MITKDSIITDPEVDTYLEKRSSKQENSPEWFSKPYCVLTFEPFVEDRGDGQATLHIGNSGLRLHYDSESDFAEMHFFPNGNSSESFASKLKLEVINSRNFVYAMYKLGCLLEASEFNWDRIMIDPNPRLGVIIERLFINIAKKKPSSQFDEGFEYLMDCQKLVKFIHTENFQNSNALRVIRNFTKRQDAWPVMINPVAWTYINKDKIEFEL
ncbi:hypothetical protein KC669_04040 [Candidatus Dojkabacteria bacterium]|uniref:Uncharacterized protein n=1 Tax=Candidatus Dojkabacteria bacterium TaxID=2099670 RepID=A0A955RMB0_9BACT|nr:hypothetical protein [Candidatus Dojkabacteria bacterium]